MVGSVVWPPPLRRLYVRAIQANDKRRLDLNWSGALTPTQSNVTGLYERPPFSRPAQSIGPHPASGSQVSLLLKLRDALENNRITYCQWKGHWNADRWSNGDGDIDLLVARPDAPRLMKVLGELGFKEAIARRSTIGLSSFYGLDEELARLIHVHVHYQVALGNDWTLNYQLPLVGPVLESREPATFFPVPAAELEFIIFVIRMVLGQSVIAVLTGRGQKLPERRLAEWQYLAARVKTERVRDVLKKHLPYLTPQLFERCVRSLSPMAPVIARLRRHRQLQRALRPYAQSRRTVATFDALKQRGHYLLRLMAGRRPTRSLLATGGAVVAVVGGDGAGKTTAVDHLYTWTSRSVDTARYHLGKPPKSIATAAVAAIRRVIPLDFLLSVRSVCIARDRYRLYRRTTRAAAQGRVVLCDRYPLRGIRGMDGPNVQVGHGSSLKDRMTRTLHRLEAGYYDRILPPDILIVLRVDPEVAAQRKTDEDSEYVRRRSREVWELNMRDSPAFVVDASRPTMEVLAQLRAIIWAHL
jgi:thymidylate kinase